LPDGFKESFIRLISMEFLQITGFPNRIARKAKGWGQEVVSG
jgi:hypothetical protein